MLLQRKQGGGGGGGYFWEADGDTVEVSDQVGRDLLELDPEQYSEVVADDESDKPAAKPGRRSATQTVAE